MREMEMERGWGRDVRKERDRERDTERQRGGGERDTERQRKREKETKTESFSDLLNDSLASRLTTELLVVLDHTVLTATQNTENKPHFSPTDKGPLNHLTPEAWVQLHHQTHGESRHRGDLGKLHTCSPPQVSLL